LITVYFVFGIKEYIVFLISEKQDIFLQGPIAQLVRVANS